jgi:hypothetical protein
MSIDEADPVGVTLKKEIALIEKPLCHRKRRRLTPKALFETVNFFICDSKLHVSEEYWF